jgi:hypothetical protein
MVVAVAACDAAGFAWPPLSPAVGTFGTAGLAGAAFCSPAAEADSRDDDPTMAVTTTAIVKTFFST